MKIKLLLSQTIIALSTLTVNAQNASDVEKYIAKYKDLAIAEQRRTGVPAAIKLAQGIHESGCGNSELSKNANNHFGIKCKSNWTGATYSYTDDAKNECFRSYSSDLNSYKDHSDFLRNSPRYASLFALDNTNYQAWASGLKKAGYATNPKYVSRIVDLIEKYNLQQYTLTASGMDIGDNDALNDEVNNALAVNNSVQMEPMRVTAVNQDIENTQYYVDGLKNGLKGFYAKKGDLLLNAAVIFKVRYSKLLEINDLADEPLEEDMFIYTEKKRKNGANTTYVVKEGESLQSISQEEAIRLSDLKKYNHLQKDEMPEIGTVLQLRGKADKKPVLKAPVIKGIFDKNTNQQVANSNNNTNYIATKPAQNTTRSNTPEKVTATAVEVENSEEETYNIANETAVETQIAIENKKANEPKVTTVASVNEGNKLDKLKAKLDKSVYGSSDNKNTSSTKNTIAVESNDDIIETRPAANKNTYRNNNEVYTSNTTKPANTTTSSSLKQRIENHQKNSNREEPVVANKSKVDYTKNQNLTVEAAPTVSKATPRKVVEAPKSTAAKEKTVNSKQTDTKKKVATTAKSKKNEPSEHTVKKGETLTSIANKSGVSVNTLKKLNKIPANGTIKPGAKIKLK